MYGEGISKMGELLDLGVARPASSRNRVPGFSYNGQRIGQGRENAKNPSCARTRSCADEHRGCDPAAMRGLVGEARCWISRSRNRRKAVVPESPDEPNDARAESSSLAGTRLRVMLTGYPFATGNRSCGNGRRVQRLRSQTLIIFLPSMVTPAGK